MKLIAVLFMALVITSCTKDFSETNTDNNVPTVVTPNLLLSGIQKSIMGESVGSAWGIGNLVAQYHAKIQFVNEDRYLWNEQNGLWNNTYSNYRNLQSIFTSLGSDETNAYYGVSLVLKAFMFERLTATYGDAPYSEAGKAKTEGVYAPKYDKQEDIYNGVLADLKKANELLAKSSNAITGDLIYGGGTSSIIKWRMLACMTLAWVPSMRSG